MRSLGITSLRALASGSGVSLRTIRALVKMRESPHKMNGDWKKPAMMLAEYFGCTVADLFAEGQPLVFEAHRAYIEVGFNDLRFIEELEAEEDASKHPDVVVSATELHVALIEVLMRLTMAERAVIRMRFGMDGASMTLRDVGKVLDLKQKRIKTILAQALRRLSQPAQKSTLIGAGAKDVLVRDALVHLEQISAD